ncbi:hypothetical protein ACT3UJ_16995 [Halomonas sp. 86]|uniref:hypothetical protein n=1 Tax=unclassified Halomonas TaxID=2609666 RepID=UPI0040335BEC
MAALAALTPAALCAALRVVSHNERGSGFFWELSLLGDGGASCPYPGSAAHCIAGALRLPRTTFVQWWRR